SSSAFRILTNTSGLFASFFALNSKAKLSARISSGWDDILRVPADLFEESLCLARVKQDWLLGIIGHHHAVRAALLDDEELEGQIIEKLAALFRVICFGVGEQDWDRGNSFSIRRQFYPVIIFRGIRICDPDQ